MTKAKADCHMEVAQYYDRLSRKLGIALIVLSGLTTITTMLPLTKVIPHSHRLYIPLRILPHRYLLGKFFYQHYELPEAYEHLK